MKNPSVKIITTGQSAYNSFDIAKIICSVLVVMIHIAPFGVQSDINIFTRLNFALTQGLCRIAVPLFFVFSGFLLYNKAFRDGFSLSCCRNYTVRILKLYIIWSIIYFPFEIRSLLKGPKEAVYSLVMYAKNFVCVGSYGHLWYFPALIFAVVITTLLCLKKWSPEKILSLSAVFYFLGLFGDAYYGIISPFLESSFLGKVVGLYFKLFKTTRNGLFFGFFFVALGMFLAKKEILIGKMKALFFFCVSVILLFAELYLLEIYDIPKDHNIMLFTIPSVLFGFLFFKSLKLKDNKIYKKMRIMSTLIFEVHLLVIFFITKISQYLCIDLLGNPSGFIITLAVSGLFAFLIEELSEKKGYMWLKNFY